MLRNIIFDMGGVLIRWDPPFFIDRLGITDPEDKALLLQEVHGSAHWRMCDSGKVDEPEIEKRIQAHLPPASARSSTSADIPLE